MAACRICTDASADVAQCGLMRLDAVGQSLQLERQLFASMHAILRAILRAVLYLTISWTAPTALAKSSMYSANSLTTERPRGL